jgi:hypothetical protein
MVNRNLEKEGGRVYLFKVANCRQSGEGMVADCMKNGMSKFDPECARRILLFRNQELRLTPSEMARATLHIL